MGKRNVDSVCPRCGGKIFFDRDYHGWYEQCLQCSYTRDLVALHSDIRKPKPEELSIEEPVQTE